MCGELGGRAPAALLAPPPPPDAARGGRALLRHGRRAGRGLRLGRPVVAPRLRAHARRARAAGRRAPPARRARRRLGRGAARTARALGAARAVQLRLPDAPKHALRPLLPRPQPVPRLPVGAGRLRERGARLGGPGLLPRPRQADGRAAARAGGSGGAQLRRLRRPGRAQVPLRLALLVHGLRAALPDPARALLLVRGRAAVGAARPRRPPLPLSGRELGVVHALGLRCQGADARVVLPARLLGEWQRPAARRALVGRVARRRAAPALGELRGRLHRAAPARARERARERAPARLDRPHLRRQADRTAGDARAHARSRRASPRSAHPLASPLPCPLGRRCPRSTFSST